MKISILGSGMVGQAIGTKLVQRGNQVMMGSRSAGSESGEAWRRLSGGDASTGTFADAARFGEIVINCTNGANSIAALRQAGSENLRGKILVDVANPLSHAADALPTLTVCNTDSLGEQIQREFPATRVVKALNTMNCEVMVEPLLVPGNHSLFICGNDSEAKATIARHLQDWFGWAKNNIVDIGDITSARGTEMLLPIWLRLWGTLGHGHFNFHVVTGNRTATP